VRVLSTRARARRRQLARASAAPRFTARTPRTRRAHGPLGDASCGGEVAWGAGSGIRGGSSRPAVVGPGMFPQHPVAAHFTFTSAWSEVVNTYSGRCRDVNDTVRIVCLLESWSGGGGGGEERAKRRWGGEMV